MNATTEAAVPESGGRLFFALWPGPTLATALARASSAAQAVCGGRAMRPDTLHLTLAFVGKVAAAQLPALRAAAGAVCGRACAFTLDRLGYWPGPRVVWAAPAEVPAALGALADDLAQQVRAAGLSLPARPWQPHVTLLRRVGSGAGLPALPRLPPWQAQAFVLVRSRLGAAGATYEEIGRWPLADR